ncbi:F-box protein CPR30-like [Herrania umbratica]|uniref:F-box protein CPR30-like n=1 Tax=Herrania umbratica TaxID=108875 RepID=A0A6J1AWF3_9ROSI|nr:F-box protein CPR30-like [Herrania umbratica]
MARLTAVECTVTLVVEIVYDILLRLPAKSLQRFKLVSKPWGSLISDPNFAESHLCRVNTSQDNVNLLRVGQMRAMMGPRPRLSLYSMDSNGLNREIVRLDYPFGDHLRHARILGSCNGLLLIDTESCAEYFLWNPSTGKYKRIPPFIQEDGQFISGLGYESTSRNYKGIIVSHYISGSSSPSYDNYHNYESLCYRVYDYRKNSWTSKDASEFSYRIHTSSKAVVVNGVPHWCVYRRKLNERHNDRNNSHPFRLFYFDVTYVIVYFDLKNENFKKVELPMWATHEMKFDLGVLGGCLSMSLNPHGSFTEVWAMKEYGIPESWTKLFVISSSFGKLRPICFPTNNRNEVLLKLRVEKLEKWIIFNLKEESMERILLLNNYCWYYTDFSECTYVGSLVFPDQEHQTNHEELVDEFCTL